MSTVEERFQIRLSDMLGTFGNKIIRSDLCDFAPRDLLDKPMRMEYIPNRNPQENLIFMLQQTIFILKHLYSGIEDDPDIAAEKIGKNFLGDAMIIRDDLMKYVKVYPVQINIELWSNEFIRSISNISHIFKDSLYGKGE